MRQSFTPHNHIFFLTTASNRFLPALLTILLLFSPVLAQFSPGKLSAPHQHLKGNENCEKCHSKGEVVDTDDCLDCHKLIRNRIKKNTGYHGLLEDQDCVKCHSDHNGKKYKLVYWEKGQDNFDHALAGFDLIEKHASLKCRDCHISKNIRAEDVRTWDTEGLQPGFLDGTFLGLGTQCEDCHEDIHKQKFKDACSSCHDQTNWHNARDKFDHSKSDFKLKGSHADVKCADCHFTTVKGDSLDVTFAIAKGDACQNCHEDVHKGKLKAVCQDCHDETKWNTADQRFDHAKSDFPLTLPHKTVACTDCHYADVKGGKFDLELTVARGDKCTNCHEDIHKNAFGQDCTKCHTAAKWKDIEQFDHSATKFPLQGRHAKVDCAKCHKKDAPAKLIYDLCGRCHEDQHKDQFKITSNGLDCARCHTESDWKPSIFGVTEHAATHFKLEGAHVAIPCNLCHKADAKLQGKIRYSLGNIPCSRCHEDEHNGQFSEKNSVPDCQKCHKFDSWDLPEFDHSNTAFPLDGKHRDVACGKCHKPRPAFDMKTGNTLEIVQYKLLPHKCIDCHDLELDNK